MKQMDLPELIKINQGLAGSKHGPYTITGKLEVYSMKRTRDQHDLGRALFERLAQIHKLQIQQQQPSVMSNDAETTPSGGNGKSAASTASSTSGREKHFLEERLKRHVQLVQLVEAVVDDDERDFSLLPLEAFEEIPVEDAVRDANTALGVMLPSGLDFIAELWEQLRVIMNLWEKSDCKVFRFILSDEEDDPFARSDGSDVSPCTLVFYNKAYKRAAMLWIRTKHRLGGTVSPTNSEEGDDPETSLKRARYENSSPTPTELGLAAGPESAAAAAVAARIQRELAENESEDFGTSSSEEEDQGNEEEEEGRSAHTDSESPAKRVKLSE